MTTNSENAPARRLEDHLPEAKIDWSKPEAPAVPLSSTAGAARQGGNTSLAELIADDSYAMTFQSMGQYRTALLEAARAIPPLTAPAPLTDEQYQEILRPVLSRYGMQRFLNGDEITLNPSDYRAIIDRAIEREVAKAALAPQQSESIDTDEFRALMSDYRYCREDHAGFARSRVNAHIKAKLALAAQAAQQQIVADWEPCNPACEPTEGNDCRNKFCPCGPAKASIARQLAGQAALSELAPEQIEAIAEATFAEVNAMPDSEVNGKTWDHHFARAIEREVLAKAAPAAPVNKICHFDKSHVLIAWKCLRANDFTIPDEALDEMRAVLLGSLIAAPVQTSMLVPKWAGEFHSHQDWVNRAQRTLSVQEHMPKAICVDAMGRRCHIGKDMARARDEDAFPVRYFWECEPVAAPVQAEQAQAEPCAPAILEAISWHLRERDDLTLEEAVEAFRNGWKKVRGRDERAMLLQLIHLMASAPEVSALPAQAEQVAAVRAAYENAMKACDGERVENTGHASDSAYNMAIVHCIGAIESLATKEAAAVEAPMWDAYGDPANAAAEKADAHDADLPAIGGQQITQGDTGGDE
jgi:hypothetical protein